MGFDLENMKKCAKLGKIMLIKYFLQRATNFMLLF